MTTRTLDSSPSILPLYVRAAAPLIPGASLLPFVPGRGKDVPDLELSLAGVWPDPDTVAAYSRVCGFTLRDQLPPTYPHVLAFPLHMAVMADGSFPFGAVGLVHVENRIVQHRPIGLGEELKLVVRPTALQPHKRGKTFSLVTEAWIADEKAWQSTSTMLRRQKPAKQPADGPKSGARLRFSAHRPEEAELTPSAEWRLGGDLGRRYAAVSGDRNPIHMHALTAKPLGFSGAIAHGMWTTARCLAALEGCLPDAFAAEVRFRKPIRLPGKVEFLNDVAGEEVHFAVRDAKRHIPHLDGRIQPIEAKKRPATANKTSGRTST
ncbi:MAG TPA: MaoC/PaaZ C-terminal domain-containing protein [Solirubrobacterales bacterium]|nr:MaoC/PaaZ C-terminal domain-containing protein [Solirubrobacterales bacterium]